MIEFLLYLLGAHFGIYIIDGLFEIPDNFETFAAFGSASFVYLLNILKNRPKIATPTKKTIQTNDKKKHQEHVLQRFKGLEEIANQERLSLNGLIVSCKQMSMNKDKKTLYCFYYLNRSEPFIRISYSVHHNDVEVLYLGYVRNVEGIDVVMNKIIDKIFLLEKERRGIEPPKKITDKSEQDKITIELNNIKKQYSMDDVESKSEVLINSLNSLAKEKDYLDIEEIHKLTDTYINDVKKTMTLYRSFNDEMKLKNKNSFIEVLCKIENSRDEVKELSQNRQINELKRLLKIVDSRNE